MLGIKYSDKNHLIDISEEKINETKSSLIAYFKSINFDGDVEEKVKNIIQTCLEGWARCPKDFDDRIKAKLGRNAKFFKVDLEQEVVSGREIKTIIDQVGLNLTPDEKEFLIEREKEYRKDYEFNNSSDRILLSEILIDELVLKRLQVERVISKDWQSIEKRIFEVQKRITTNMEKLGILRSQRIDNDMNIQGNVAQLSVVVEKKLNNIRKIKEEKERKKLIREIEDKLDGIDLEEIDDMLKQIQLQREHDLQPIVNRISDSELQRVLKEVAS